MGLGRAGLEIGEPVANTAGDLRGQANDPKMAKMRLRR